MANARNGLLDSPELSTFGQPEQVHPISRWVLRAVWLVATFALVPAGMAFYSLRHPFGTNPPPPLAMMIGGSAFTFGSLVLIGLALWLRTLTYFIFHEALVQVRGGSVESIRPADRVFFEPGEEHWHGAAPDRFLTHLAMLEVDDDGNPATWGAHVTDDEYAAAPPTDT